MLMTNFYANTCVPKHPGSTTALVVRNSNKSISAVVGPWYCLRMKNPRLAWSVPGFSFWFG